jgi:hypothetical protein|tara:strand:- start:7028 stop:9079 length:2052 start_codon:yes stop_codon:yes gene_type:complete
MSFLLNLQTDLKSLKFGKDRPVEGSSQQPYVTTAIPPQNQDYAEAMDILGTPIGTGTDALIRGGISSAEHIARDLERIGKWFFDTSNPRGLQFVANQGILSEISVRTQASIGAKPNQGFYSPLQTLYQIGTNNVGGHSNRFLKGLLNPLKQTRTYMDVVAGRDSNNNNILDVSIVEEANNRLVLLNDIKQLNLKEKIATPGIKITQQQKTLSKSLRANSIVAKRPNTILRYQGGPNSVLGAGNTDIFFAKDNQGRDLRTGINNPQIVPHLLNTPLKGRNGIEIKPTNISDFRSVKLEDNKTSTIMGLAPNYNALDAGENYIIEGLRDSRIRMKSPGQRGNIIDYAVGKTDGDGNPVGAVDLINAQPIYRSGGVKGKKDGIAKNDLVKFRIAAIDSEDPSQKEFIHFRAFINNFTDNYQGNWNSVSYMGRGEDFYRYSKFARSIQMDFTVAAQSKPEIMEQYKKLNFLVSNAFPDYTKAGYMAGPLVQLTMGGWCYELPGFFNSVNLDIPQESPWEIGIDTVGNSDHSVKEMPHYCNVSLQFTPIHDFRPSKQKNTYNGKDVVKYGQERYIALSQGYQSFNNYDNDIRPQLVRPLKEPLAPIDLSRPVPSGNNPLFPTGLQNFPPYIPPGEKIQEMKSNTGNYPDSPSKRQLKKANKQELKRIKNLDGFEDIASNIGGGLGNNI